MPPTKRTPRVQPAPGTTSQGAPITLDPTAHPAGPPEGTDHGHAGVGGEVPEAAVTPQAPPADPEGTSQPLRAIYTPTSPSGRLVAYLAAHHPGELGRTTPEGPEHPADTAVRLLTALGATRQAPRCPEAYCNLPANHDTPHGWVNAQ